jgi:hypothetical protein
MVMDPKEAVTKRGCSGAAGGSAARKVKTLVWAPSPTELTLLTWEKVAEICWGIWGCIDVRRYYICHIYVIYI